MIVYIKENTVIAKLAAIILKAKRTAVTIGNKIYLHNCCAENFLKNKNWVCHELVHVHQYKRKGKFKFLCAYLFQSIINGYTNNKFEIEATQKKHDYLLLEEVQFIII